MRDIVLMTSRAKDSVLASVEWGSDVENILKIIRVSNGLSFISELDSSTSLAGK